MNILLTPGQRLSLGNNHEIDVGVLSNENKSYTRQCYSDRNISDQTAKYGFTVKWWKCVVSTSKYKYRDLEQML